MGSTNPFGGEGNSINRPPIFNGEGYAYWKIRMRIFIEAIDTDIWEAIENGPYVPQHLVEGEPKDKPKSLWTDDEKKRFQHNLKAKNIITSALSYDEFFRVSQCANAKDMWDTLQVTHEGTSEVKRARLNALCHEYELFRMLPNENINDMQKRFTHIVNHLMALGKTFVDGELTNKVLRCLDRNWQPKVTAIMESKNLDSMPLATLFGKLQEHEMELSRLSLHEESDRKKKGISLKATSSQKKIIEEKSDDDEGSDTSDIDDEATALLVRKFGRFLKKRSNYQKKGSTPKDKIRCHECGKLGHIKFFCPQNLKKTENEKNDNKDKSKTRRAYIVWDAPEEEKTSSTSEDEESANLCFMVNHKDDKSDNESSEVSDSDSDNYPNYDELYNAFHELHEELKKQARILSDRKRIILVNERKILALQKLNDELEFKIANSLCDCASKIPTILECENCEILEEENDDLKKSLAKFTRGRNNLNTLLGYQRNSGQRSGLGYKPKSYKKLVGQSSKSNNFGPTCFYCGLQGHITSYCKIRKYGVPRGCYEWIVKGQDPNANSKGPKTIWVPKSFE